MNMFDMFVCFNLLFLRLGKFLLWNKKRKLGGISRVIIIVLAKICGSSAYISPNGNQSICSSDLKGSMVCLV